MKRLLTICTIALAATTASAQRYVIEVANNDGKTERIDTRRTERIDVPAGSGTVVATMADGTTRQWRQLETAGMTFDLLPPRLVDYTQSVENDYVHRFITETVYDPDDYEYSHVLDYADHSLALDEPSPMIIRLERSRLEGGEYVLTSTDWKFSSVRRWEFEDDQVKLWHLAPGDSLYYRIMAADGTTVAQEGMVRATGQVRMIYAPSVNNIRDMGGWPVAGGGHIRYGRLFRGTKWHDKNGDLLSREDSLRLRELGIKCEFDLRDSQESAGGNSAGFYSRLGRDIDYCINGHGMYAYVNAVAVYPQYFRYGWNMIKNHVFQGDPIYVHCSHGCDRMGTWAMVIEGVLGVSENNINLDYELSAFAPKSGLWRYRNMHQYIEDYDFRAAINYIKSLPGETLRDKFEYFLVSKCNIPKEDILRLREMLIER